MIGQLAGVATALSWSLCAHAFTAAGRRIGSMAVNHLRLLVASAALPLIHLAVLGSLAPRGVAGRDLALLVASGFVGLVLGDAAGFRALVLVGAARTTLLVTLTPAFATLLAGVFLKERLPPLALAGMGITVAGLVVSVRGRQLHDRAAAASGAPGPPPVPRRVLAIGLSLALLAALGQATGQVLARPALAAVDPLSATVLRVWSGAALLGTITLVACLARRRRPAWWGGWSDRRAVLLTLAGTATGPIGGVWLSLVATRHAPVGVAATLMALVPLFVLAEDALSGRRRPDVRELVGAVVAILGVVLLLLALER